MSKVNDILENKVMPVAAKIAGQRHLQALRDGIILTMPLIIIGSLFLILGNLPITGYPEFMARTFGDAWRTKLSYPVGASFDIMALIAAFGIAYRLAEKYKVDALSAGAISVAAFLLATPYSFMFQGEGMKKAIEVSGGVPTALLGSKGLFVAMIIAMVSTEIYRFVIKKNIIIKMPDGVPPAVSKSFVALIPGFFVFLVVWLARLLIEQTSFESLHNIVGELLQKPLGVLGGSLIGGIIAVIFIQLLWSCGLHGAAIVGGVMSPIWLTAMDQNRIAFEAHQELPNVITSQFFDIFVYLGGSGTTLGFVLAMLFFSKSQQSKQLGRLAIGPGIFNINEPVVFGAPIVLNPLLLIPFILTPIVMVIVTYVAMSTGIVPKPAGVAVPWTMIPIIGGYLATGGKIAGALLQIVNLVIAFLIYFPFFKAWDKQNYKMEQGS
ncbi:PTS cellobiose transporter subunit IIC [Bacillus sp. FJAT-49736]|uniref:PTS cellobiose transporter subunit IIC n=1 Tax=Bacillus sp. FJAT-49736 TaxID=2833582 RepID=UPI001BCA36BF|nr:PTS cellobiose transporter subunit IIC [Bacillus sp. FJAT-49736]MBS4174472.1 PTS cellobiose transporter subunit IIC [Bacillus sp. FJAT-49736]MBS4175829.1 PTS cellobiose transporter subunit IIC [Bacillus sp. FJAT-49736]